MHDRCPWCPLTQQELIEKYCDRCEQEAILPEPASRCHALGLMLYRDDNFAAAAEAFRAANEHSDTFLSEPAFNLSLSEYRLSRYDAALTAIEQVIERSPLGEALYVKGIILQRLCRSDEAEIWLLKAEAAGVAKAQEQLADLRMRRDLEFVDSDALAGDPEKRLACLTGVLARLDAPAPRHTAHVLSQMGRAATQLGDLLLARDCLRRACEEDLTAETATELAEFVLDHGGEEEEAAAEQWLAQALSLDGEHGRAWHCLGRLQQGRGQLPQAFHSMLSAVRASPSDEYALFETAELAAEMGNVSLCLSLLARLEALASSDPYWLDRARTLRRGIGAY